MDAANPHILIGMAHGARLELKYVKDELASLQKADTPLPVGPDGPFIPESAEKIPTFFAVPPKIAGRIRYTMRNAFNEDYWKKIANDNTRKELRSTLQRSIKEGWTGAETIRHISEDKSNIFNPVRAERIVRTETTAALNGGQAIARDEMIQEGLVRGAEWLAVLDRDTRDTHGRANGQQSVFEGGKWVIKYGGAVIAQGKQFVLGASRARFPADPQLPARERIHCRCTTISIISPPADSPTGTPDIGTGGTAPVLPPDGVVPPVAVKPPTIPNPVPAAVEDAVAVADEAAAAVADETAAVAVDELTAARQWAPAEGYSGESIAEKLQDNLNNPWLEQKRVQALQAADKPRAQLRRQMVKANTKKEELYRKQRKFWVENRRDNVKRTLAEEGIGDTHPHYHRRLREAHDSDPFMLKYEAEIEKLNAKIAQLQIRELELSGEIRKAFFDALALDKNHQLPLKPSLGLGRTGSREMVKKAEEAVADIQKIVSNPHRKNPMGIPVEGTADGRAYAMGNSIHMTEAHAVEVYAHEIGHVLENNLPFAQRKAKEWVKSRIRRAGTKDFQMEAVFKRGYAPDEFGNFDGFEELFGAGESRAAYTGKTYSSGATEILSMGIEEMFRNPVRFAEVDPEFFRFVYGILTGVL